MTYLSYWINKMHLQTCLFQIILIYIYIYLCFRLLVCSLFHFWFQIKTLYFAFWCIDKLNPCCFSIWNLIFIFSHFFVRCNHISHKIFVSWFRIGLILSGKLWIKTRKNMYSIKKSWRKYIETTKNIQLN